MGGAWPSHIVPESLRSPTTEIAVDRCARELLWAKGSGRGERISGTDFFLGAFRVRFELESSARERWLSRPMGIGRGGQEGSGAQSRQEGANRAAQLQ